MRCIFRPWQYYRASLSKFWFQATSQIECKLAGHYGLPQLRESNFLHREQVDLGTVFGVNLVEAVFLDATG